MHAARPLVGLDCPDCGLSLASVLALRRTGCPGCYRAFRDALAPLLRHVQGRPDSATASRWRQARSLRARMDEAVLTERFERAAVLRDLLAKLKARGA